jgi:hypothetical protein
MATGVPHTPRLFRYVTADQVPFADVAFVDEPEPRCPNVLVRDASGSMPGRPTSELNTGPKQFQTALSGDP